MMGNFYGGMMGTYGIGTIFGPIIYLVLLAFLILGCIYFWKQINRK